MSSLRLHRVQIVILDELRHSETARFSDLMRHAHLESDVFKFHLKKLVSLGYVEKLSSGSYALTTVGKEFANNLDTQQRAVQKQPKLSVLLIVPEPGPATDRYLFQRRARSPYYGFWSCIGGPVQWGEEFEAAAARELKKQTSLSANFAVRLFYRKKDYSIDAEVLLEDKLFVVLEASHVQGELANMWAGGHNEWMSVAEFEQQQKRFDSACGIIALAKEHNIYTSQVSRYDGGEY